jgi:hypothetical protein
MASEGLVRIRPRSGVFVESPRREEAPQREVVSWMVDLLLRGLARGIPPVDLAPQVRACLDGASVRVGCVECNDDQLYALCQQARCDYGFEAVAIDTDATASDTVIRPRSVVSSPPRLEPAHGQTIARGTRQRPHASAERRAVSASLR